MAGIMANSVSQTMVSGDTAVNKSVSGYLTNESVALTTSPSGTVYSWSLAKPAESTARSVLLAADSSAASFVPDVAGDWLVSVNVDGTTYTIIISVLALEVARSLNAVRLVPTADNQIPTPATGKTVYYSSTQTALATKDSSGVVETIDSTTV